MAVGAVSLRFLGQIASTSAVLLLVLVVAVNGQKSEPKLASAPEYKLSKQGEAAGIGGVFTAFLLIDQEGRVDSVKSLLSPPLPCSLPNKLIEDTETSVRDHLKSLTFVPAMKNGKPVKSEITLSFKVGDSYKRAHPANDYKADQLNAVQGKALNGKAVRLPKPQNPGLRGVVNVQVLIDEEGNVISAGVLNGPARAAAVSREAACESKFSPTLIGGTPVRVSGVVTYSYHP